MNTSTLDTGGRFCLDADPDINWPAEQFGPSWNGWDTPKVTRDTLVFLLLHVIADEQGSYRGFAISGAGAASIIDVEDHVDSINPNADGLYDLTGLGWTFSRVGAL